VLIHNVPILHGENPDLNRADPHRAAVEVSPLPLVKRLRLASSETEIFTWSDFDAEIIHLVLVLVLVLRQCHPAGSLLAPHQPFDGALQGVPYWPRRSDDRVRS